MECQYLYCITWAKAITAAEEKLTQTHIHKLMQGDPGGAAVHGHVDDVGPFVDVLPPVHQVDAVL